MAEHWILTDVALGGSANVAARIRTIEQQRAPQAHAAEFEGEVQEIVDNAETLSSLLLTTVNGDGSLPVQRVIVEYLRADQALRIPYFLVMAARPINDPVVPIIPVQAARYLKVTGRTYAQIYTIVENAADAAGIREAIDALNDPPAATPTPAWRLPAFYRLPNGALDSMGHAAVVYGMLSQVLGFNCDIRDTGYLLVDAMRMEDAYWAAPATVTISRLDVQLFAYSRQCLAALNLKPCDDVPLGAWVRSFGVSCGVLPTRGSASLVEYKFVVNQPAADDRTAVLNYETDFNYDLYAVCMNLIAVFGILHLSKDHTFKTNDATMARICTSFLRTLRTMVDGTIMTYMEGKMEVLCRTAAHPFGLGQTYAVAILMQRSDALAPALSIRIHACPPGVQRFMIARAAMKEWSVMAAGRAINASMAAEKEEIEAICNAAEGNPPAYSGLWRLYGIGPDDVGKIAEQFHAAASAIMPIAVAYAESQHMSADNQRDGLALAMSITNIKRENSGLVAAYTALWDKYFADIEEMGIVKMVEENLMLYRKLNNLAI